MGDQLTEPGSTQVDPTDLATVAPEPHNTNLPVGDCLSRSD